MKRYTFIVSLILLLYPLNCALAVPIEITSSTFHVEGRIQHEEYYDDDYHIVSKSYDIYSQNPISQNAEFTFPDNPEARIYSTSTADFFSVYSYAYAKEDSYANSTSSAESIVYFKPTYDFFGITLGFDQTGSDYGYGSVIITDVTDSIELWNTDHYDSSMEPFYDPWVGDDGEPWPGYPFSEIVTQNFYSDHLYALNMMVEGVGDLGYFSGGFGVTADFTPLSATAPVPEPSSMILFGTGIAGLIGLRRKKIFKSIQK